MSDSVTIFLYISILSISTMFAFLSQSKLKLVDGQVVRRNNLGFFLLSFFVLAFFSCFSGVGIDRAAYEDIFGTYSLSKLFEDVEPGFALIILFLRLFFVTPKLFVFLLAFFTLVFVYSGIWKCRRYLSVGLSIFIFSSLYYLQSYNIMRMYFAMSILICFANLIFKKKYIQYTIILLIASSIHYSILFVLMAFLFFLITRKLSPANFRFCFVIILVTIIGIIFLIIPLFKYIIANISMFSKYSRYLNFLNPKFGVKWVFNLLPYFILIIFAKYTNAELKIKRISYSYLLVFLFLSLISYIITILGRATLTLNMTILILLPSALEAYKKKKVIAKNISVKFGRFKLNFDFVMFIFLFYVLVSLIMYLKEYLVLDGIKNYCFVWNL